MKFMVLTSAAFAVGHLWIAAQQWWSGPRGPVDGRRIASVDDLPVGGALAFTYPAEHDTCLLVRVAESEFVAFSQKCTHLSCAVVPRPAENSFYCPCHEGRFDLRSGRPVAGPPRRPLPRITLAIRGRDIFATGVEERAT
jgi:Rieske Fe-S protein